MKRLLTVACLLALVALAAPAGGAVNPRTFSQQSIAHNGIWYSYGSPTVNHFRSALVPWGVVHTDANGRKSVVRIGSKTMWIRWTLVGYRQDGILAAATEEDLHYMDRLEVVGSYADGGPGDGTGSAGAGNLVGYPSGPHCREWAEDNVPAFVGAGPGTYCAKYDHTFHNHNFSVEYRWYLNQYPASDYWFCFVRSTVATRNIGWANWWFLLPVGGRIAGAGGFFWQQRHMGCGSTVATGFGGGATPAGTTTGYIGTAAESAAVAASGHPLTYSR